MGKINIAEILKDCPRGMELDCTMSDGIQFDKINTWDEIYPIVIRRADGAVFSLTKYGQYIKSDYSKCVIFPKGKTTWEGFVPPCKFKDGDILSTIFGNIFILNTPYNNGTAYHFYAGVFSGSSSDNYFFIDNLVASNHPCRLATEEEKQKLFKAIKDNGYKWNAETKTLEKLIEPKFKVGDRIQGYGTHINHPIRVVKSLEWDRYRLDNGNYIKFGDEHAYKLLKFDITTLKPFDKVLVRDKSNEVWTANFYSHYDATSDKPFICVGWSEMNEYSYCIPYEANKELLGTTNNIEEYGSE